MSAIIIFPSLLLLCLFDGIFSGHSNYFVYTTADDDRCCSVRLGNEFCSAIPLTSRLILLENSCPTGKSSGKGSSSLKDLDDIYRRLNVLSTYQAGKKVLLHLESPLSKTILDKNLLCLSDETNHINLEKCTINLGRTSSNVSEPILEFEVTEPIVIRSGQGLSIVQKYELNLTNIRIKDRRQRQCYDWYRSQTKKICRDPCTHPQVCVELNDEREKCLERLLDANSTTSEEQKNYQSISLTKKAKLSCANDRDGARVLGRYRRSQVCFHTHYQVSVEHQFSDRVYLSDKKQNRDVLKFLANHTELAKEFQSDCHDKKTLANLDRPVVTVKEEEVEQVILEHQHDEP